MQPIPQKPTGMIISHTLVRFKHLSPRIHIRRYNVAAASKTQYFSYSNEVVSKLHCALTMSKIIALPICCDEF